MYRITKIEVEIDMEKRNENIVLITRGGWKTKRYTPNSWSFARLGVAVAKDVNSLVEWERPLITFTPYGWVAEW